jgi:hypothetical protein
MIMNCVVKVASKVKHADTGRCPECGSTEYAVSVKGFIGVHPVPAPIQAPELPAPVELTEEEEVAGIKARAALKPERDRARKGKGLSESQAPVTDSGLRGGAPRTAERRRQGEIIAISGDAPERNAKIIETLREGDRKGAMVQARALDADARATADSPAVPHTLEWSTRAVSGDTRGGAFVNGGDMPPVQRKSGYLAAAGTMAMRVSPTPRPDKSASEVPVVGKRLGTLTFDQVGELSEAQRRRYYRNLSKKAGKGKARRAR